MSSLPGNLDDFNHTETKVGMVNKSIANKLAPFMVHQILCYLQTINLRDNQDRGNRDFTGTIQSQQNRRWREIDECIEKPRNGRRHFRRRGESKTTDVGRHEASTGEAYAAFGEDGH